MSKIETVLPTGLILGNPFSAQGLGIIPIICNEIADLPPIDTLDSALAEGYVTVREVSFEGEVGWLAVENKSDLHHVLILEGQEILTAHMKQRRTVNATVLVPPNTPECKIPTACIQRQQWSYKHAGSHQDQGSILRSRSRIVQKQSVSLSVLRDGDFRADQRAVWDEVDRSLHELRVESPTADYRDARMAATPHIERVIDSIQPLEGQIGGIFVTKQGILGCELVGSPSLYASFMKSILSSYCWDIANTEDVADAQFSRAKDWWKECAESLFTRHKSPGIREDVRFQSENLIGSGLLMGTTLLHLSCFPMHGTRDHRTPTRTRRSSSLERRKRLLRSNILA